MSQVLMTLPVPLSVDVGIAKPVIGAQVDDPHSALEERGHGALADTMRQAAEDALHASGPEAIGIKGFTAQIDPARQAGVQLGEQRQICSLQCPLTPPSPPSGREGGARG